LYIVNYEIIANIITIKSKKQTTELEYIKKPSKINEIADEMPNSDAMSRD